MNHTILHVRGVVRSSGQREYRFIWTLNPNPASVAPDCCVGVHERLAGCMMYIKEAMYISQCSTCGASLALVALGCLPAYRYLGVVCDGRVTPTTTVYLSTTKLNSGTYLCVCRVMATSPHLDVHQLECCRCATEVTM